MGETACRLFFRVRASSAREETFRQEHAQRSMGRTAVSALVLGWLSLVSSDSAILISEPQDFDEVS